MLIVAVFVNMLRDEPTTLCHLAQSSVKWLMTGTICGIHAPSSLLWPQGHGLRTSGQLRPGDDSGHKSHPTNNLC